MCEPLNDICVLGLSSAQPKRGAVEPDPPTTEGEEPDVSRNLVETLA